MEVLVLAMQKLEQGDRQRICFLAGGAPRDPGANRPIITSFFDQLREDLLGQRLERLRLAEKARDVNQQILIERADLRRGFLEQSYVMLDVRHPVQRHAAEQAALDGRKLVVFEVDATCWPQEIEDAA